MLQIISSFHWLNISGSLFSLVDLHSAQSRSTAPKSSAFSGLCLLKRAKGGEEEREGGVEGRTWQGEGVIRLKEFQMDGFKLP